jgi:predicted nucleic acid-binding protein
MGESELYFIDTNIFLRTLVLENPQMTRESAAVLRLIKNGVIKAYTNDLVIAEINWVLRQVYLTSKEQRIKSIKGIIKLKNLKIVTETDFLLGLNLYEQYNIKFIDALIAANRLIQKRQAIIVSYNKDFDKIKGIKRLEPKQILKKYG